MLSYSYYLHFPRLQKYSYNQDKNLNGLSSSEEKREKALFLSRVESELESRNSSLYILDWSKQDQLFKESISPSGKTKTLLPYDVLVKNPQTAIPEPFSTLVDNFKFIMNKTELEEIHKGSRLTLDIWNALNRVPTGAYVVSESLEEALIASTSYCFAQLSDYLYANDKHLQQRQKRNVSHSSLYYDRSVDKRLATSAMLLRFWFGQISFEKLEKYSRIDKLKEYQKTKNNAKELCAFLKSFEIYNIFEEQFKAELKDPYILNTKVKSAKEAEKLFQGNKEIIKDLQEISENPDTFIDYNSLLDSVKDLKKEAADPDTYNLYSPIAEVVEEDSSNGCSAPITKVALDNTITVTGTDLQSEVIALNIEELNEEKLSKAKNSMWKRKTDDSLIKENIDAESEGKVVKEVRKEELFMHSEEGFVAELCVGNSRKLLNKEELTCPKCKSIFREPVGKFGDNDIVNCPECACSFSHKEFKVQNISQLDPIFDIGTAETPIDNVFIETSNYVPSDEQEMKEIDDGLKKKWTKEKIKESRNKFKNYREKFVGSTVVEKQDLDNII